MAEQVEVEGTLFDLTVAPFEPLTPGSGGGVLLGKKEKLANAICDYGVLDTAGSFEIVHLKPETKEEREEHDTLTPTRGPSCPYPIPVNPFLTRYRKGKHNRLPKDPG